jgi:Cu+-exporting ATPase
MGTNAVFKVSGMTCSMCGLRIEKGLRRVEGITKVAASYASEKVSLEYEPEKIEIPQIKDNLTALGFSVVDPNQEGNTEAQKLKKLFIWSAILTAPMILMMLAWPEVGLLYLLQHFNETHHLILDPLLNNVWFLDDWRFQLALATPVQFIIGARFYKNAYYSLKAGTPNMDVLVAVGSSMAYFYTVYQIILYYTDPVLQKGVGC